MKKPNQQVALFEASEKAAIMQGAVLTPEAVRLLANFEVLAEAPDGIRRLRELILGLAVRGKLVPQDSSDHPASTIVSEAAKDRRKNNVKAKLSSPVDEERRKELAHFTSLIPATWAVTSFDELAAAKDNAIKAGPFGSALTKSMYALSGYKIYGQEQVIKDDPYFGDYFIDDAHFRKLESCSVAPGDILISLVGTIGKAMILPPDCQPGIINPRLVKMSITHHVLGNFIKLYLRSPVAQGYLGGAAHGGTMDILNLGILRSLPILLPPLAEQARIVAKVDELMALCDEMEARQAKRRVVAGRLNKAALGELTSAEGPEEFAASLQRVVGNFDALAGKPEGVENLRKAILELAMRGRVVSRLLHSEVAVAHIGRRPGIHEVTPSRTTDGDYENTIPYDVPDGWTWVRLGNVLRRMQYGTSEKAHDHAVGVPVLRMGNLKNGNIVAESLKYVRDNIADIGNLLLDPGDILFNRTNSYELVGKSAVFHSPPDGFKTCTFASYLIRVTLDEKMASPTFVNLYFATPTFRATQIAPGATQQTGQANFSGGKLKLVWIPLPPLAEQARIVAKVDHLMALCDSLEAKIRAADEGARCLAESLVAELIA